MQPEVIKKLFGLHQEPKAIQTAKLRKSGRAAKTMLPRTRDDLQAGSVASEVREQPLCYTG